MTRRACPCTTIGAVGTETVEDKRRTAAARARARTRFERRAERAIATHHAFRYLTVATVALSVLAGVLMWVIDRRDFDSIGEGVWWALQTLSTVGYGDVVPHTTWGRLLGGLVIALGVTFLAMLTATITAYLVAADQDARQAALDALRGRERVDRDATLTEILERVRAIEEQLKGRADR
jgi:voltage-gated potassium channel